MDEYWCKCNKNGQDKKCDSRPNWEIDTREQKINEMIKLEIEWYRQHNYCTTYRETGRRKKKQKQYEMEGQNK